MHGISPVDEDAIPVSYIYSLKGILLIQPQWDATPIDKDAIETIKVQGKESGLWFTRRKDAEPRNVEESVPIQRPPLTNSNSMWLLRKPLVEEPVEEPVAESVKPAAPARRERSMTTLSFWPARCIDWSRSGSRTSQTCTKPAPNPGFGVRCSWRAEPEPHLRFRFGLCPNPHLGFKPRCTSVHPFQCTYTLCSQFRDFWTQTAFLAHRKRK